MPGIVVTGASGFIGRHFIIAVSGKFRLFCIARRSQKEVGIPYHKNIHWLQLDITNQKNLLNAFKYIKDHGGAEFVLHLAGFKAKEVKEIMYLIGKTMKESLLLRPKLKGSIRQVDDYIILTSQLAADEFEDAYEILEYQPSENMESIKDIAQVISIENLKRIVRHLEDVYSDTMSNRPYREEAFDNHTFFVTLDSQNE